jgi:hypothetical protein
MIALASSSDTISTLLPIPEEVILAMLERDAWGMPAEALRPFVSDWLR